MKKVYIGIDNGVTGTIGILEDGNEPRFFRTPTKVCQDYSKTKKNITRVDFEKLYEILLPYKDSAFEVKVCMERPMVNPSLWKASESALRAFEVTWACIEFLKFPHSFCASTDWQKALLPQNLPKKLDKNGKPKGYDPTVLKKASLDIGNRLFPQFKDFKHPDRDGLLIAEWERCVNKIASNLAYNLTRFLKN